MPCAAEKPDRIRAYPDKLRAVHELRRLGWTRREVADAMEVSLRTVDRWLRELERVAAER